MVITAANVGNVICMNHMSRHILVEAVTDRLVQFRQETGERYATFEREIDGSIVLDPARISEFHRNSALGAVLANAEISAISKKLNGILDREELEDADAVFAFVKSMQKQLQERSSIRQDKASRKPHASLDSMIFSAKKVNEDKQQFGPHEHKLQPEKDNVMGR